MLQFQKTKRAICFVIKNNQSIFLNPNNRHGSHYLLAGAGCDLSVSALLSTQWLALRTATQHGKVLHPEIFRQQQKPMIRQHLYVSISGRSNCQLIVMCANRTPWSDKSHKHFRLQGTKSIFNRLRFSSLKQIKKKSDDEIKSFLSIPGGRHISDKFRRLLNITNDQPHSYYTRCSHI